MRDLEKNVKVASTFLKSLANRNRLVILATLAEGEKSVGELQEILDIQQPTLSQQLARLRGDKMVNTRRDAKQIYYSLNSDEAEIVMGLVFELFRAGEKKPVSKGSAVPPGEAAAA